MDYIIAKTGQILGGPNGFTLQNFIIVLALILLASLIASGGTRRH